MGLDNNVDFRDLPLNERNAAARTLDNHIHDIYVEQFGQSPKRILEIKGRKNLKPEAEYIPFVQDFVKSGKFSSVGDLKNTDLFSVDGRYFTEPELVEAAKKYGRMGVHDTTWEVSRKRHLDAGLSEEEALLNWVEAFKEGRGRLAMPRQEFAHGGAVHMAEGGVINLDDLVAQALSKNVTVNLDDMVHQALTKRFAKGGAAYNAI
jgi:hypothetical protein